VELLSRDVGCGAGRLAPTAWCQIQRGQTRAYRVVPDSVRANPRAYRVVPDSVRASPCLPGQARRVQAAYFLRSLKRGLWGLTLRLVAGGREPAGSPLGSNCPVPRSRGFSFCSPSPQPLSRQGRGAYSSSRRIGLVESSVCQDQQDIGLWIPSASAVPAPIT